MLSIMKSLLFEYGAVWTINRLIYSIKLRLLNLLPAVAVFFERLVNVKRFELFSLEITALGGFLKLLPDEKQKELIETADAATAGQIKAFSSLNLDYGSPIDWQLNPITSKRADVTKKWYNIADFDEQRGDIKAIWEPSRLTHFFYFARAYLLTYEKKYYEAFSSQLAHWLKANPYPYGANFKCGQECSLRMMNVLLIAPVFADLLTPNDVENIIKLVERCYKKIRSNFFYAHKCIKNNHTFSEIVGLIVGAWCCEDEKKMRKAYRLLESEIQRQFTSDGGYLQYSFNYQRFTLQLFEAIIKMGGKTGHSLSEGARETIKNSVLLLYQMQQDNGCLPNYGSNDGALVFPLSACDYRDFRPCLNTLYTQLTGSRLYYNGEYDEELYWFGNPAAPVVQMERISMVFDGAGLYSLRNHSLFAMLVCQDYKARPSHFDQLHFDLWYNGIEIFCDSGTYSYADRLGSLLSATGGHNVIIADSREQMNKKGAFFTYNWTRRCKSSLVNNIFSGSFYSQNGYAHKRIVKLREFDCEIIDEVVGAKTIEKLFHTPCDVKLQGDGFCLKHNGKIICEVRCSGEISVLKAKRSLYYMRFEEVSVVSVKVHGKSSIHICFIGEQSGSEMSSS